MNNKNKISNTKFLAQFGIMLAIEALFCFTPLGSIPLGPIVATLAVVPVVVTGITMGPKAGTLMGFFAGMFSFLIMSFAPPNPITAFVFTPLYSLGEFTGNFGSILICFVPRILVGTVAGALHRLFGKVKPNNDFLQYVLTGFVASMVNTVLVMGGIWLFFGNQFSSIVGQGMLLVIGTTVLTNGIPEGIIAGLVARLVCKPLKKMKGSN